MRKTIGRRHLVKSDDCDKHSGDQMIVMNTVVMMMMMIVLNEMRVHLLAH